jgi:putative transcriptional regulator
MERAKHGCTRIGAGGFPAVLLLRVAALLLPPALLPPGLHAAPPSASLGPGTFLVAVPDLPDPNFRQAVVLLIDHDPRGSWGLVINRPTPVRLAEALPEEQSLRGRSDRLFAGGPVAPSRLLMLLRSQDPPAGTRLVFDDVHLAWTPATLGGQAAFRLYAGYAGWGPGQLEAELSRGDWLLAPAQADLVFSEDPEGAWGLLVRRTPLQVAARPAAPTKSPGVLRRRGE